MRAEDDLTYQEYKENVEDAMRYMINRMAAVPLLEKSWLDTETGYRQNDG